MPGESGLELMQWVRERRLEIVMLFCTVYADFNYAQKAVELHSFDYFLKPIYYPALQERIGAAVQEARYYNERFTRREYTSAFRTYTERFGPLYMAAVRETAEDPDGRRVLAEQLLDLLEAGWKRQRPWNRTMVQAREKQMLVTYLSPMLLGLEEPLCQELAERLRDGWNTRRPKDIYNITTYARLQEGFRNVILGIDITGWQKRREEES